MTDVSIEADDFGRTIEQILGNVSKGVSARLPQAVDKALEKGEEAWRRNANSVLSGSYSRGGWGKLNKSRTEVFKSGPRKGKIKSGWYGKVYKTGRYAKSIRHRMDGGGMTPEGEIGSPTMPGLAHLLEKGHASIGGGFVAGREHIATAAEEAFSDFDKLVDEVVEEALNDA